MSASFRCISLALFTLAVAIPASAQDARSDAAGNLAAKLQPFVDSHTLAGVLVANRNRALVTNIKIDRERGLVLIYMVQHAGYPNDTGKQIYPTFAETARELFAR